MKFIYNGQLPIKDVDLTLAGIFKPEDTIVKGTVFEVPDNDKTLINKVKISGIYEPYIEPKKVIKPKFKSKKDKKEEIKEEK